MIKIPIKEEKKRECTRFYAKMSGAIKKVIKLLLYSLKYSAKTNVTGKKILFMGEV